MKRRKYMEFKYTCTREILFDNYYSTLFLSVEVAIF